MKWASRSFTACNSPWWCWTDAVPLSGVQRCNSQLFFSTLFLDFQFTDIVFFSHSFWLREFRLFFSQNQTAAWFQLLPSSSLLPYLSVSSCDHKHFSFFLSFYSFFWGSSGSLTLTVLFPPPGTCPSMQDSCVHHASSSHPMAALHSASAPPRPRPARPLCSHLLYCLHPLALFTLMELSPWLRSADRVCFWLLLQLQTPSCSFTALPLFPPTFPPSPPGFLVHHSVCRVWRPTCLQLERGECRTRSSVLFQGQVGSGSQMNGFQPGSDAWRNDSGGERLRTCFLLCRGQGGVKRTTVFGRQVEKNSNQTISQGRDATFAACLSENKLTVLLGLFHYINADYSFKK